MRCRQSYLRRRPFCLGMTPSGKEAKRPLPGAPSIGEPDVSRPDRAGRPRTEIHHVRSTYPRPGRRAVRRVHRRRNRCRQCRDCGRTHVPDSRHRQLRPWDVVPVAATICRTATGFVTLVGRREPSRITFNGRRPPRWLRPGIWRLEHHDRSDLVARAVILKSSCWPRHAQIIGGATSSLERPAASPLRATAGMGTLQARARNAPLASGSTLADMSEPIVAT